MAPPLTRRVALGIALLGVGGLAGCALPTAPVAHHILVHKESDPIDGKKDKLTPQRFETEYLKPIRDGIEAHVGTQAVQPPARIMLFVHGGLNTYEAGLERVNALVQGGKLLDTTTPSSSTGTPRSGPRCGTTSSSCAASSGSP